jgi:hypothetical protein
MYTSDGQQAKIKLRSGSVSLMAAHHHQTRCLPLKDIQKQAAHSTKQTCVLVNHATSKRMQCPPMLIILCVMQLWLLFVATQHVAAPACACHQPYMGLLLPGYFGHALFCSNLLYHMLLLLLQSCCPSTPPAPLPSAYQ